MADVIALEAIDEQLDDEIVKLRLDGFSHREIARRMGVSEHTVRMSLRRTLPKINAPFREECLSAMVLRLERLVSIATPKANAGDHEAQSLICRISMELRGLLALGGSGYDPSLVVSANAQEANSNGNYIDALKRLGRWIEPPLEADELTPVSELVPAKSE
jgi:hypothetical protein